MKKTLSVILAVLMLSAITAPAVAQDYCTGTAAVVLTAEAAYFNVTVPATLPVHVDAAGNVTTATDCKIINNSAGPVVVQEATADGITFENLDGSIYGHNERVIEYTVKGYAPGDYNVPANIVVVWDCVK